MGRPGEGPAPPADRGRRRPGTREGDLRPDQVRLGHRHEPRRPGRRLLDPGRLEPGPQHRLEHAGCPTRPTVHQIPGEADYLDWARRFYDWTNTHLQSPSGLYWDHLDLRGTVEKTFWSYNQGVPVGVNVLLYEVTHDRDYLRRAERIAEAAYDYYVTQGRPFTQPVFFNSIFFKNLLLLEAATKNGKYHQAMADYADQLWSTMREPATGLVHFDAAGGTEATQQAALAQIYAVLAWLRAKRRTLY
jgi:rhamnogalacturonyl hydrolase YesR